MKNLLRLVAFIVAVFVAGPPAKHFVEGLFSSGSVPQSLVDGRWESQSVGNLSFDAPWSLWTKNLDLPAELAQQIDSSQTVSRERNGLTIMAMRVTYVGGLEASVRGAVEGAEKSMRATPGTKSVQFSSNETTIGTYPGAVIDALVTREKGEQLRCHCLLVARKESLYQLLVTFRADQPNGELAWRKLRATAKIDGRS